MAWWALTPILTDLGVAWHGGPFGQFTPPLIDFLKSILKRYPDGQILKELIQNADDAGATEVKFLLDTTEYGTTSLLTPSIATYQGAALYCYNDSVFNDADWKSIQSVQQSVKKKDPLRTGRFGLGFVSVYHITDMPSIMSADKIVFFDPFENRFREGYPGWQVPLDKSLLTAYHHQFLPFTKIHSQIGFGDQPFNNTFFNGTLMRFPLRKEISKMSSNVFKPENIDDMFESFKEELDVILLFLKSVEKVSVYKCSDGQTNTIFQVKRDDADKNAKHAFFESIERKCLTEPYFQQSDIIRSIGSESTTTRWLIFNQLFNSNVSDKVRNLASELGLLPLVGLAMPVVKNKHIPELSTVEGRVFCVLPLPPDKASEGVTGLPLHVHAYFGLADNRRSLKWPAIDQKHDAMAEWNELIVTHLLPEAYSTFILHAISISELSPYSIYQAWPNKDCVKPHWNKFLHPFVANTIHKDVLFTKARRGQWISLTKAIFGNIRDDTPNVTQAVISYLESCDKDVVVPPEHVFENIRQCDINIVTPQLLRNCVRTHYVTDLSYEEKILLLQFSLHDDNFEDLLGLPLLPVSGNKFTTFKSGSKLVLFPTSDIPQILLPALEVVNQQLNRDDSPLRTVDLSQQVLDTFHQLNNQAKIDQITVSEEEFYKKYLFPNLRILHNVRDDFVLDILLQSKWKSRKYLKDLLQSQPCIPTSTQNHTLSKVRDLIDPTSKLAILYEESDMRFPCGEQYETEECLSKLYEVGMARYHIEWEDVIERAQSIKTQYMLDHSRGLLRVTALIKYLEDKYRFSVCPQEVCEKLQVIRFLPIMKKPTQYSLPWYSTTVDLDSPSVLYASSCRHLVSVVKPVVNEMTAAEGGCGKISQSVRSLLKLNIHPPIDIVIKQLFAIANHGYIEGTTSEICYKIYKFLSDKVQTQNWEITEKLTASNTPFLLTCESFVLPKQMSFSLDIGCEPYLYRVTDSLKPFLVLLKACGVRENFDVLDYVNAIKIAKKLGCAEIDYGSIVTTKADEHAVQLLVEDCLCDYRVRADVANVLNCHLSNGDWCTMLSEHECTAVLKYFQEDIERNPMIVKTLKNLPIYPTMFGDIVSIAQYTICNAPQTNKTNNIPNIECDKWLSEYKCVLLKWNDRLQDIYEVIGIRKITTKDVYMQYILPHFQSLSKKAQLKHLINLRQLLNDGKEPLAYRLRHLGFIPDTQGTTAVLQASRFYDPDNKIFHTMLPDESFPPSPFRNNEWLPFLRLIGLHKDVSQQDFINFAKQIEKTKHSSKELALSQSKMLIKFMTCNTHFHNALFFQEISNIKFVPVDSVDGDLLKICPKQCTEDFTYFNKSIKLSYAKLVWTVAPLLPDWADPCDHQIDKKIVKLLCENLNLQPHPPLKLVLEHCQILSNTFVNSNSHEDIYDRHGARSDKKVRSVWENIYQYLMEQCEKNTRCMNDSMCNSCKIIKLKLENVPIIMVDEYNKIVKAKQIVMKIPDNKLEPFIYSIPLDFGPYASLFHLLGATENMTEVQLAGVLEDIYTRSYLTELDPNTLITACHVICLLFTSLKDTQRQSHTVETFDKYLQYHNLYLISTEKKIKLSSELVFHDIPCNIKKVKGLGRDFLVDFRECGLHVFTGDLLKLLPKRHRPTYLSSIVRNEIVNPQPCKDHPSCHVQQLYQCMLSSEEFSEAIHNILIKEDHIDMAEAIKHKLQQVTVMCLDKVYIELINVESNTKVVNSMRIEQVHLGYDKRKSMLYLHHDSNQKRMFISELTKVVAKLLGGRAFSIQMQIQDLLLCQNSDGIFAYLLENGYVTDEGNYSYFIPPVGIEIPESDLHFLNHNPNHYFKPGEFVGYQLDIIENQSTYMYAQIVKEVKKTQDNQSTYFIQMYEINIGKEETVVVTSLDLYKIKQKKHGDIVPTESTYSSQAKRARMDNKPLQEMFEEITKQLESILSDSTLTEEQKRKAIKRLYLLWHPDKNIGNEEYAGEVFKHIKNELDRLEKELSKSQYSSGSSRGSSGEGFRYSYDKWDWEARADREREQRWFSDRSSSSDRGKKSSYPSYSRFRTKTKSNPTEGKRWFRQANADLHAASKDMKGDPSSFEWVCFKCQQAVEKALKGGFYTVLGYLPDSNTHNILSLASKLSTHISTDVTNDVIALLNLRCDHLHPRYPDMYGGTRIPNDAYTQETAKKSIGYAKRILDVVTNLS
uniref:Sacsin-like n=1 Tax=Saccoglossus kowalevskii TaxID=10224 RepID=A0ABM0GQ47_SACKO|nr:PREDICTED: sacsin-like [Saccoglossus kowalevskii]